VFIFAFLYERDGTLWVAQFGNLVGGLGQVTDSYRLANPGPLSLERESSPLYYDGGNLLTSSSLQLDMGIIAACAPTLRPLLGRVLRLSDNRNHYNDANYYRAGKALDRIPKSGSEKRGYLRQNTASGVFVEGPGSPKPEKWAAVSREKTSFTASVRNGETVKADILGEKISIDEDAILQLPPDPHFKGIVKTTEFKVEK